MDTLTSIPSRNFIRAGGHLINLDQVTQIELNAKVYDPTNCDALIGVRVHMADCQSIEFTGTEANLLRRALDNGVFCLRVIAVDNCTCSAVAAGTVAGLAAGAGIAANANGAGAH